MLRDRLEIIVDAVVDAEVDDLESRALHHHADKILADVVDVALDGADHHLAHFRRAGRRQKGAKDRHAGLHRVGRHQHFRHEQNAVAEIDADDPHALDQGFGQDMVRLPAAVEQNSHALLDLFLEAVVEVIVHLLDEFVVGEGFKVEFAFGHWRCSR